MINICETCGTQFEAIKSTKKYCCRSCQNKAAWIRKKEKEKLLSQGIDPDVKQCLICGSNFKPKDKNANQRTCCYNCMPEGHQLSRSEFIDLIRKQRGGKCERCGYDKYQGALEFHHIDPSEKDFTIGDRDFKLKDCVKETKKCILICANCHREIHAGLSNIEELNLRREEEVEPNGTDKETV